jgi:hypothetical protein
VRISCILFLPNVNCWAARRALDRRRALMSLHYIVRAFDLLRDIWLALKHLHGEWCALKHLHGMKMVVFSFT